jgi:protein tyrosine/serine phosphatase
MSDDRRLQADGLTNARDLGGLPLRGGGRTPTGRIWRSATVDGLTEGGWETLRAAGIRTVVDLRSAADATADAGIRPDWVTTVRVDHDGLDDEPAFWSAYWSSGLVGTPLYYGPHLEELPERTGAALRAIADAGPGGVVFHCAAGRDRTGIVALALLSIAGVEPEAVVADYLTTFGTAAVADEERRIASLCAAHGTTVERAFRATLAAFDADGFVERAGLDGVGQEALRTFRAHAG